MPFSAPVLTYRAKGLASNIQSKVLKVHNTLININITAISAPEMTYTPTFIRGVKLDYKAVKNTIIYNVTNGITEGFVNKLKIVKRIMYGKASIELLKNKLTMEHVLFN